jgi:hypothetical protein
MALKRTLNHDKQPAVFIVQRCLNFLNRIIFSKDEGYSLRILNYCQSLRGHVQRYRHFLRICFKDFFSSS